MGIHFWIRRFLLVAGIGFLVITGAQLLRGRSIGYAIAQGVFWSVVAATIFTVSRFFQSRRGQHCAICNDIPEAKDPSRGGQP
ncbi:MAG: hypothetical protein A3E01_14855 [Gammaproteobacteria bacterium RIFCSPHIGHO2_12_FULL_63_22]|nr:MAG: hypothetical protein A3E01_14855 [Gammaproteobacteria bacterium RIFCSPHIGHO2_12_FULL_63_22]